MEIVNKELIKKYAERNTSPKFPLQKKIVNAFVDSILNSSKLEVPFSNLKNRMTNTNYLGIYNSYWPTVRELNSVDNYRYIIAYAMLKKDENLFKMISETLFTGTLSIFDDSDITLNVITITDRDPDNVDYTDQGSTTDAELGVSNLVYINDYSSTDVIQDGKVIIQGYEQFRKNMQDFEKLMTIVKPCYTQVFLINRPNIHIENDVSKCRFIKQFIQNPLTDEGSKTFLKNMDLTTASYLFTSIVFETNKSYTKVNRSFNEISPGIYHYSFHIFIDNTDNSIPVESYFKNLTILSHNTNVKNFVFTTNWVEMSYIQNSEHYQAKLDILIDTNQF